MINEKAEILSLFQLNDEEKQKLRKKFFNIDPAVCVCSDFTALLHSDGTVEVNGKTEFNEQKDEWYSITKICGGNGHIIGLRSDGTVVAFGDNSCGQCNVSDWNNIKDIFANHYYSAAVTDKEQLLLTGRMDFGSFTEEDLEDKINTAFSACDNNNEVRFSEVFALVEGLKNYVGEHIKKQDDAATKEELKKELRKELLQELKKKETDLEQIKKDLKKEILIELRTEIRSVIPASNKAASGRTVNAEKQCMKCMKMYKGGKFCPYCGFDSNSHQDSPLLPLGRMIKNGKYIIGAKISQNHEGVKYAGYSTDLKSKVVIHEFLPLELCTRAVQSEYVTVKSGSDKKFAELREKFLKYYYAISSASKGHAYAKIHDVFSDGGTSYIVEEFVDGATLKDYVLRKGRGLDWNTVSRQFRPIAALLADVHAKGEGHYAVSPDHIIVCSNGEFRLVGFAVEDVRHIGGLISADLVKGCSAIEQYDARARLDETTDIYGFTASVCYALTGILIEDANTRKERSAISIPAAVFNTLPKTAVDLIKGGLWVSQASRIRTFKYILNYII